jgi:hypothetical protein
MAKLIYATPTSLDGYIADENYLATPATNYLLRRVFRPHRRFPLPSRAPAGRSRAVARSAVVARWNHLAFPTRGTITSPLVSNYRG